MSIGKELLMATLFGSGGGSSGSGGGGSGGGGETSVRTTVGELPFLAPVQFGRWNGMPLYWYVADTDYEGHFILGLLDGQLPELPFDGKEAGENNLGHSKWNLSNIRQFFNSTAEENWYEAQHEKDLLAAEYDGLPAFLAGFTQQELACIVPFSSKCVEYSVDGSYEIKTYSDRVWLPSKKLAGGAAGTAEGNRALACTSAYMTYVLGAFGGSKTGYIKCTRTEAYTSDNDFSRVSLATAEFVLANTPMPYTPFVSVDRAMLVSSIDAGIYGTKEG